MAVCWLWSALLLDPPLDEGTELLLAVERVALLAGSRDRQQAVFVPAPLLAVPSLVLVVCWFGLSLVPFSPVSVSVRLCVQMGFLAGCNVCLCAVCTWLVTMYS